MAVNDCVVRFGEKLFCIREEFFEKGTFGYHELFRADLLGPSFAKAHDYRSVALSQFGASRGDLLGLSSDLS